MLKYFTILLLLACHLICFSQSNDFNKVGLNVSEHIGLPSSETYKVKQDSRGNIWVMTNGGVIKYNGDKSKLFTVKDGMGPNTIFNMYEDYKGRVWFYGISTDLYYYENDSIKEYPYNTEIKNFINNQIRIWKDIVIDTNDNLYYSINSLGVFKITPQGEITHISKKEGVEIKNIGNENLASINVTDESFKTEARTGLRILSIDLHFGDSVKLFSFKGASNRNQSPIKVGNLFIYLIYEKLFINLESQFPDQNFVFIEQFNDKFVLGTNKGFYIAEIINNRLQIISEKILPSNYITSMLYDRDGNIWVSTLENGVIFFSNFGLSKSTGISEQTDENIYNIACVNDKIHAFSLNQVFLSSGKTPLKFKDVKSISTTATFDEKIILAQGNYPFFKKTSFGFKIPYARDIKVWNNTIMVSSSDKIYEFDTLNLKGKPFFSVDDLNSFTFSKKIEIIDSSTVLSADLNNLRVLGRHRIIKLLGSDFNIKQIKRINSKSILVLDEHKGIFLYDIQSHSISAFDEINRLLPPVEYTCFEYNLSTHEIFIGSTLGLIRCNIDKKQTHIIDKSNGLPSNRIHSIYLKDKYVYLGLKGELFRLNILTPYPNIQSKHYYNDFFKITYSDSSYQFSPTDTTLKVSSDLNYISISLPTRYYNNWESKSYQFRTSKTNTWITTKNSLITLTNLNKSYDIEMRFKLNALNWSEPISIAHLIITPPIYLHWTFICIYIFLLFTIIYLLVRIQLKKRVKNLEIQNNLLSHRQRLQNARIKPHFIFNVLNSINSHILFNENKEASNYLIKFSRLMRNILDNTGIDVTQIEGEYELLKSYLELEQLRREHNFDFEITLPQELNSFSIPSLMIQPFVENAILHRSDDVQNKYLITVCFEQNTINTVSVNIYNSSIMTDEQMRKWKEFNKDHAVGITKERLVNYKSLYKIESLSMDIISNSSGTTVSLTLPILKP